MTSQARQDWNAARIVIFWLGAAATVIVALVFLILAITSDWDAPFWYVFNLVMGPLIAYVIAWIGAAYLPVRPIAVVLFLVAVFFTFLAGTMVLYAPGFLALMIGTPDRPALVQEPHPET